MGNTRDVGRDREEDALAYLVDHGLQTVRRNFSCRGGEIDLIMRDRDCLVFVEVRYRRSGAFGGALASVDARKRRRLLLAAQHYIASSGWRGPCRFDVVAYEGGGDATWVRDAFSA